MLTLRVESGSWHLVGGIRVGRGREGFLRGGCDGIKGTDVHSGNKMNEDQIDSDIAAPEPRLQQKVGYQAKDVFPII